MAIQEIGAVPPGQSVASNIPPPPAEVKVRTMRSDIDALSKNGGALPQFRAVAVEGLSLSKMQISGDQPQGAKKKLWPILGIAVLALAVLGVIVWFGYGAFAKH